MSEPCKSNRKKPKADFHHSVVLSFRVFILFGGMLLLISCQPDSPPSPMTDSTPFRITFVGDVLLGDAAQPFLDQHGYLWPFERIPHLIEADYAIANAEGPITTLEQPWDPDQIWSYNAQPEAAQALADLGFDAVGFSNNHTMDRGPQGIADTIAHLESHHLSLFGAGSNQAEAETPLIIETPYGLVGVVGLGDNFGKDRTAAENHAGTVPLSKSSIRRGYQLALDAGADWVIGYVHWGTNYANITVAQRSWTRVFAQEGYDLVVGHGAHSIQPVEIIRGMPVIYSVGNFVFGTPGRFNERFPGFGLVLTANLQPDGINNLLISCIQTDNQIVEFQPRPCTNTQAQQVFNQLHDGLLIEGAAAVLNW